MLRARQEIYPSHAGKAGVPGNAAVFYAPPRALASPQGDGTRLVTSRGRRTARRRAAESANVDPPPFGTYCRMSPESARTVFPPCTKATDKEFHHEPILDTEHIWPVE